LLCKAVHINDWKKDVEYTGTLISKIEILSVVTRAPEKIFSIFIDTGMITLEGERVSRCMLIRGKSVVIVPVIHCDIGDIYTLIVKQRRPVDGAFVTEFPGGMFNSASEPPASLALLKYVRNLILRLIQMN
jgi:hypothetical protein